MGREASVRSAIILLALVVALSACDGFMGESQRPPCDCPNAEAAVTSVDWLADGRIAEEWGSGEGFSGELGVWQEFKRFDGADQAIAAFDGLLARLETAGFAPANVERFETETRFEDVVLEIGVPVFDEGAPSPEVWVNVSVLGDDANAAEALQPLVDALGTID